MDRPTPHVYVGFITPHPKQEHPFLVGPFPHLTPRATSGLHQPLSVAGCTPTARTRFSSIFCLHMHTNDVFYCNIVY